MKTIYLNVKSSLSEFKIKVKDGEMEDQFTWIGFNFTKEEDLFLVSNAGLVVYLDIHQANIKNI